jgi:hypothetical protein
MTDKVIQVIECLLYLSSKCESLSSNPSTTKKQPTKQTNEN